MSKVARTARSWLKKQDLIWGRVSSAMAATFPIIPYKYINIKFNFLEKIILLTNNTNEHLDDAIKEPFREHKVK